MPDKYRIATIIGTRPEAIKLAPVIQALSAEVEFEITVISTGQHREMLDQVFELFKIRPTVDLDLMRPGQSLTDLAGRALQEIGTVIRSILPHMLIVQGDTTSAFVGSLAAFYERVPSAHVEAGLRTFNRDDPFPEEINRKLTASLATLHFAPTSRAKAHLLAEGVPESVIEVTGNTVVDALRWVSESSAFAATELPSGIGVVGRTILVTLHRRESWGEPMAAVCIALRRVLDDFPDVRILLPMHRNPVVRGTIQSVLGGHSRACLSEPLDYVTFVKAMSASYLVVTDSGGIQEEAPTFGRPVLVARETTERPEAVEAGTAQLVGTSTAALQQALTRLLVNQDAYDAMSHAVSPFGDGFASARIVRRIKEWFAS